jgi:hypothetical protein
MGIVAGADGPANGLAVFVDAFSVGGAAGSIPTTSYSHKEPPTVQEVAARSRKVESEEKSVEFGAVEWIRTTTVLLPPAPQAGASASSATTALR